MPEPDATLAAIDLGSNSFHMIIARLDDGELKVIDRLREPVRLAGGFDADNNLAAEACERALDCLRRFGERVRDLPREHVRAVGTNTLRKARNAKGFIAAARAALGHPIEVISGREEARILYLGVARSSSGEARRRLVVDIGGGSTECIIGHAGEPKATESMHMGCIGFSLRFFPHGKLTIEQFKAATLAARVELEPFERRFRSLGWEEAIGSSGTIKAIDTILRQNGWGDSGITRDGLRSLRKEMVRQKSAAKLSLPGLSPDRADILAGGLAILYGVFRSLEITTMSTSSGALREGLLYELVGRIHDEDTREQAVRAMVARFGVDVEQAARVEATAVAALAQVVCTPLDPEHRKLLCWAARLHELGLAVSYTGHHRHGGYLIANSDMSGFSREQQTLLADLVRSQRRRLHADVLKGLSAIAGPAGPRLALLLRLAVALNRRRDPKGPPAFELTADAGGYVVRFAAGHLDAHPLTVADLKDEQSFLAQAGFAITVASAAPDPS